ncbi:MAG: PucR family transcriptional regulator ligand-binding domain-containing protein [Bacillus sp. (in: Bacteria)]|nr:PucR family transcriptional regulator ligand-binding domain-containing protein [Bacillus sp. (in: firmicutes)]
MITISEILELPIFTHSTLIAGKKGLNKSVRWLTILELLDDIKQLDQGEILLTTAFDLSSNENLKRNLIKELNDLRVAAIIIQTGYYLEEIPKEMIEQSNQYGFPIIELPKTVSFSEITKIVHKHILNKQFEEIQFSEEMYRKFTEIALNNKGLNPIAKAISNLVMGQITIYDIQMNVLCSTTFPNRNIILPVSFTHEILRKYIGQEKNRHSETVKYIEKIDNYFVSITTVKSKNDKFGYIVSVKIEPFTNLEEIAIKHASTISTLEFINLSNLEDKDNQLKSDFLELVLTGNYTDELTVYSQGEILGIKIGSQDTCVAIIKIDNHDHFLTPSLAKIEKALQQTMIKQLQDYAVTSLFKRLNGQFVILITKDFASQVNIQHVLTKIMDHVFTFYNVTLSIGIGNYYNDFNHYRQSFKEAQESLFIIESVWKKHKCLHYKDLGLYKLLLPILQNTKLIEDYYHKILGNIIDDELLLETLRVYLEDMKMNEAADKLFIHRHTLKYRIKKIENLTERKISNFKDRIELELALIIHNMIKTEPNPKDS